MANLEHLIYASVAVARFGASELGELLQKAQESNARQGISGMLLHSDFDNSFFQVLEGEPAAIDGLLEKLRLDKRHAKVTVIIREPIAERSFADWSMGLCTMSQAKLRMVPGLNDFFRRGSSFSNLDDSRSKKLLAAFAGGRWRPEDLGSAAGSRGGAKSDETHDPDFTLAFQPIVDVTVGEVVSYEALLRGPANESAYHIFEHVAEDRLFAFDQKARVRAIDLATRLGISCGLHLNFMPRSLGVSAQSVITTLEAAQRANFPLKRLVLDVIEGEVIDDAKYFTDLIKEYRALGVKVAFDDFGGAYSDLKLLADFQPDQVKLDMQLIRGIEGHGPRQAIVRAINQLCFDLGIDVIAEGVETEAEYSVLASQGVTLFQGYLFAEPGFESFPDVTYPAS